MEDTQNSAPEAQEANKLNSSGQKSDTQSVTKRFVHLQSAPSRLLLGITYS